MEAGKLILLAFAGLSAGAAVAAGLFSFIVELGVIADFADRTHTGERILFYESSVAWGGILGNLFWLFGKPALELLSGGADFLHTTWAGEALICGFGLFAGIFTGCWAMALAEILNVFPVFMRRARLVKYTAAFIVCMAAGKSLGALLFFWRGW